MSTSPITPQDKAMPTAEQKEAFYKRFDEYTDTILPNAGMADRGDIVGSPMMKTCAYAERRYRVISTSDLTVAQWEDLLTHLDNTPPADLVAEIDKAAVQADVLPAEPPIGTATVAEHRDYAPPESNAYPVADTPETASPVEGETVASNSQEQQLANLQFKKFSNRCWLVRRCAVCGHFDSQECCGQKTSWALAAHPDYGRQENVLVTTSYGRQAAGLEPIQRPEPPLSKEEMWKDERWWSSFSGVDELKDGGIDMLIDNFLPEGIVLIVGPPKEGKSWLAMSVAKALTSGQPMFGNPRFKVTEPVPVLYLAAEVSDRALKQRAKKFGITTDKTRFLCRTLSKGPCLGLGDPHIETVVQKMRPVIILDTLVRFNEGTDEDSASENQKLANAIFHLRSIGARTVAGIHHSRKDLKDGEPTMERAVRGSGDLAAMCDVIWAVVRDEQLYKNNSGPNEVKLIGWGRDFNPEPMRLALTTRAPKDLLGTMITFAPGLVSCIDQTGDLAWVDKAAATPANAAKNLEEAIQANPTITLRQLATETGVPYADIRKSMKGCGWTKGKGRGAKWKRSG